MYIYTESNVLVRCTSADNRPAFALDVLLFQIRNAFNVSDVLKAIDLLTVRFQA